MKKSSSKILEYFPELEKYMPSDINIILENQALQKLEKTEQVFLKLIWFFEKPYENNFNLYDLLKNMDQDWLSFSLEVIIIFFYQDTYMNNKPDFSIIAEDDEYLSLSDFAKYLNENKDKHGKNFSRQMVNIYVNRGVIPAPDITIGRTKYWLKETCAKYLKSISINK